LNEQRGDCPDIDIDICGARRDELLDYVYEHWGRRTRWPGPRQGPRVAMIASFITMARAAGRARKSQKCLACHRVKWTASRSGLPQPSGARNLASHSRTAGMPRPLPIDDEPLEKQSCK